MKKLMTMIGAVGLAFAATAAIDDALLTFSTVGPDKYSDGTTVLDGECYALLVAPVATGGHCPNVLFQIPAAQVDKGGTFGVYLLDTRVKAEDGTMAPAGLKANGKLSLVNGYGLATEATKVAKATAGGAKAVAEKGTGGQAVAAGAAAPNVQQPKITSIQIQGDFVKLTVQNLPGFMRVSSGADVSADDTQGAAQATDGKTNEVILYAPKSASGSGFFKVIRN